MIDGTTEQQVPEPVSAEAVSGGSYIPQQPSGPSPANVSSQMSDAEAFARRLANDSKGRASNVNDFDLTMSGIVDGDPVGMETFDLGFFEDGTPAIKINGADVPIRHDQWMALLTQRNRTREQVKQQMMFDIERDRAKQGIQRILASAPSVPPQLGNLLMTIADTDPGLAMRETSDLLASMAKDNGRSQSNRLGSLLQDSAVSSVESMLESTVYEPNPNGYGDPIKTTPIQKRVSELSKDPDQRKKVSAYALQNYRSLMPPKGFKASPEINGQPVGFLDITAMQGADIGPLSQFDMLRHLAAYSGVWPESVSWQDPPAFNPNAQVKVNPAEVAKFREYLTRLDAWASRALKWDYSSPQSIDMMMQQLVMSNAANASAQQAQPMQPQAAQPTAVPAPSGLEDI
jgi:hypothetical protein